MSVSYYVFFFFETCRNPFDRAKYKTQTQISLIFAGNYIYKNLQRRIKFYDVCAVCRRVVRGAAAFLNGLEYNDRRKNEENNRHTYNNILTTTYIVGKNKIVSILESVIVIIFLWIIKKLEKCRPADSGAMASVFFYYLCILVDHKSR